MEREAGRRQRRRGAASGLPLAASGAASIAALFVVYSWHQSPELATPEAVDGMVRMAAAFYAALVASMGAVAAGLRSRHRAMARGPPGAAWGLGAVAAATWNRRSSRILAAAFVGYGALFSVTSGALVYQPDVSFSRHYGVDVPSAEAIPCCGEPGYMPKVLVYATDHVGIQIVPVNVVLQAAVSYMVGINAALALGGGIPAGGRGAGGGIGAAAGLFVACPTCAGTALSVFAGAAGGIVLGAALAQMQTLLMAVSIPVLLAAPLLAARRLGRRPPGAAACAAGNGA